MGGVLDKRLHLIHEAIYEYLDIKHEISGEHNGCRLYELQELTGLPIEEVKNILNQMFTDNLIQVRETLNYKVIMKK